MSEKMAVEILPVFICCDSCDYHQNGIALHEIASYIGKPCPVCEANLLTQEDYVATMACLGVMTTLASEYDPAAPAERVLLRIHPRSGDIRIYTEREKP